ncbi:YabP/YqfC family sporulation protein [Bengtsoniella intestinalis]|uniref:YabP/YqfC family sporulation protein n=1 Tax=Bengtsoniella intestinalis TaxID=3073143 RepID=UPI00391F1926
MDKLKAQLLTPVAELFDLPADLVAGLPRLEMIGQHELFVAPHGGLLSYTDTQIDINTAHGVVQVNGEGLTLLVMTGQEVRIGGQIASVLWVR